MNCIGMMAYIKKRYLQPIDIQRSAFIKVEKWSDRV